MHQELTALVWLEGQMEFEMRCFMSGNHQFTSDWGHDLAHFRELGDILGKRRGGIHDYSEFR